MTIDRCGTAGHRERAGDREQTDRDIVRAVHGHDRVREHHHRRRLDHGLPRNLGEQRQAVLAGRDRDLLLVRTGTHLDAIAGTCGVDGGLDRVVLRVRALRPVVVDDELVRHVVVIVLTALCAAHSCCREVDRCRTERGGIDLPEQERRCGKDARKRHHGGCCPPVSSRRRRPCPSLRPPGRAPSAAATATSVKSRRNVPTDIPLSLVAIVTALICNSYPSARFPKRSGLTGVSTSKARPGCSGARLTRLRSLR